jgi:hypothetical protein
MMDVQYKTSTTGRGGLKYVIKWKYAHQKLPHPENTASPHSQKVEKCRNAFFTHSTQYAYQVLPHPENNAALQSKKVNVE